MVKKIRKILKNKLNFFPTKKVKKQFQKIKILLAKKPFTAFFIALGVLFLIILLGNTIAKLNEKEIPQKELIKTVKTYHVGNSPKVTLQGEVEHEGIINIVAQSPGIVQKILVNEGDEVKKGQQLINLSTNYQGGSAPGVQASIAGAQYKNVKETYETQKDLVNKQREVALKTNENTEELRKISEELRNNTETLLNSNREILRALEAQTASLEQSGAPSADILQAKQLQSQARASVTQIESSFNNLDYSTNKDNPPTKLSDLQKDITLKQLDLQDKSLDLNKEISGLSYSLASIQASLLKPSSPFQATVERIHVGIGESVNPGTILATISSTDATARIALLVPFNISKNASGLESSIIHINGESIPLTPSYVSSFATEGQLYSIFYDLPKDLVSLTTDSQFVPVDLPVASTASAAIPFIPIDSVYQTQQESYVFIYENGKVASKTLTLGSVYGSFVEVKKGLNSGDKVILSRNVVEGDRVKAE